MEVHLVDGTYELFRHHFAVPSHVTAEGVEVAATRGVLGSILRMIEDGATHIGVATDRIVASFRNDLFAGYKTGEGIPPELFAQFPLVEAVLEAAGFTVFPMVEFEADDALAAAAVRAAEEPRVKRVLVCSPDKDLAQCVTDDGRIMQLDRRQEILTTGLESSRSSGFLQPPSPTGWPWSGTPLTASPAYPGGGPSPRPPFWPAMGI